MGRSRISKHGVQEQQAPASAVRSWAQIAHAAWTEQGRSSSRAPPASKSAKDSVSSEWSRGGREGKWGPAKHGGKKRRYGRCTILFEDLKSLAAVPITWFKRQVRLCYFTAPGWTKSLETTMLFRKQLLIVVDLCFFKTAAEEHRVFYIKQKIML